MQRNSGVYGKCKTTYLHLEMANSKQQTVSDKQGS